LSALPSKPQVLWLTPKSLEQIFDNLRELGEATGRRQRAEDLIAASRARLEKIDAATRRISSPPRVSCMEWVDPVYCSGHWAPEIVVIAGGRDELGRVGSDSIRIPWKDVLQWAPELMIVMPCGCDLEAAASHARRLFEYPGWSDLPAVQKNQVCAVDASSYFARPGPRIVKGTRGRIARPHLSLFAVRNPT